MKTHKFVIKNRQKRKYTKKSEEISSFSFSKTAYSMIPLIIMLIAFMSSVVISAPIRNTLSHISFTFELPQFSLNNPISFFQTSANDIAQIGFALWTITQMITGTIVQSAVSTAKQISNGTLSTSSHVSADTLLLINFSAVFSSLIGSICLLIFQEIMRIFINIGSYFSYISTECLNLIRFAGILISSAAITTGQYINMISLATAQQIIVISEIVFRFLSFITINVIHFIILVTLTLVHFVIFIGQTILDVIISAFTFVGSVINNIALAIIHAIEIPFKVLYAFGELLKPYVDIFDKHLAMSGSDFSNMTESFSKIASQVHPAK